MKKSLVLIAVTVVAASFAVVGCQNEPAATASTPARVHASAMATTSSAAVAAPASSADKVGIAECDDYLTKYETCVNSKVPIEGQATLKASFDAQRKAWQDSAKNPAARASLAQACTAALTMSKQAMGAYGCAW